MIRIVGILEQQPGEQRFDRTYIIIADKLVSAFHASERFIVHEAPGGTGLSYAAVLARSGAPLKLASDNPGHQTMTTTGKYFAGFDSKTQEICKSFNGFYKKQPGGTNRKPQPKNRKYSSPSLQ